MTTSPIRRLPALAAAAAALLFAGHATAASGDLVCTMKFQLKGWSAIYSQADGTGVVTCSDGSSKNVAIKMRSVGATVGKSSVDKGIGKFTDVHGIDEVVGKYLQSEVHAGLAKSASAQVVTKGKVSLALAGEGDGVDLGLTVGELTLEAAK